MRRRIGIRRSGRHSWNQGCFLQVVAEGMKQLFKAARADLLDDFGLGEVFQGVMESWNGGGAVLRCFGPSVRRW